MKELIGLFLLFSSLLITRANAAEFQGKAAEKIIMEGKVLKTYYSSNKVAASHVFLIVYKKQIFHCVTVKNYMAKKLGHICNNSD